MHSPPKWPRHAGSHVELTRSGRCGGLASVILAFALVAAACGGASDAPAASVGASGVSPTSAAGTPAAGTPAAGSSAASTSAGESNPRAEVSISGSTFVFEQRGPGAASSCGPDINGTFIARLRLVDESGQLTSRSGLELDLSHDGVGAPGNRIVVRLGHLDEAGDLPYTPGWYADADQAEGSTGLDPGTSQVDSYVIDGDSVSGTATFVDFESDAAFFRGEIDAVESVPGTFMVTCGT
jgi:hypothetical protein